MRGRPLTILLCLGSLLAGGALSAPEEKKPALRKPALRAASKPIPTRAAAPKKGPAAVAKPAAAKPAAKSVVAKPAVAKAAAARPIAVKPAAKSAAAKPPIPAKPAVAKPAAPAKPTVATPIAPATPAEPGVSRPSAPQPAPGALGEADAAYARKSYAAALKGYRAALKAKQVPENRRRSVELRVAECLGLTEQWDAAAQEAEAYARRYENTLWEARARAWQMELYQKAPGFGWRVGDRVYYGRSTPEVKSDASPEQVSLHQENQNGALRAGERAKALYEQRRDKLSSTSEEADLSADLASVVANRLVDDWARAQQWRSPTDALWKLDPEAAYSPEWAPPKKVLQLFLQAERLGDARQKPLARLAQALWLRGYHTLMASAAVRIAPDGKETRLPYPYQERAAQDLLRSLIQDYPDHPEAEHARLIAAGWLSGDGKFVEALAAYRAFLKERPGSPWAVNAKAAIAELTRLTLEVTPPQPRAPGKQAVLDVAVRNVPTAKFSAYRIKLEDVVKDPRMLLRPREGFEELFARLGRVKGIRQFYGEKPVTWETTFYEKDDYAPHSQKVETPLTRAGAYIVEVDGGPVRAAVALLISDLAVIQVVDQERVHAMVVNATTGAPVVDAVALFREVYYDGKDKAQVSAGSVVTGPDGLAEKPLAPRREYSTDVRTFAWKGDRYAFTGGTSQFERDERDAAIAYVYTERPVYRPAQTVRYRALVAGRAEDGAWKPLPGQKVRVRVTDPRQTEVHTASLTAGEFGSVHGELTLGSEPPLGEYSISVEWPMGKESEMQGGGAFRVEEYKKPEFEVRVRPGAAGLARSGEPQTAKIAARYYFGAPVANARVKYTVTGSVWLPESPFRGDYDFLYSPTTRPEDEEDVGADPDPIGPITGAATTDAGGEATIQIPAPKDPRWQGRHIEYHIRAEVTDASRRTIEGAGEVRALASQFNAFVRIRRGFYSPGDRLVPEVRTLDAAGRPVSVIGTGRILRVTYADDGTRKLEEVFQTPVGTDAQGRGSFDWVATQSGRYLVRFESRDAWEQLVVGDTPTWVSGEGAPAGTFHNRHVALVAEATTYRIGDRARVLLVANQPDTTVLLTQEAGSRILKKQVIRMTGRSQVLEIPLTRQQLPDIVLAVTGVRDRELFRSQATLYVPPAGELLKMEVSADKQTYRPGEKAVFLLRARDVDGRPVRTEASVGVVDAALFYIQRNSDTPIASALYAEERGSDLDAQESLAQRFDQASEDDQPPLKFEVRAWRFPRGLGKLHVTEGIGDAWFANVVDLGFLHQGAGGRNPFRANAESAGLPGAPAASAALPTTNASGEASGSSPRRQIKDENGAAAGYPAEDAVRGKSAPPAIRKSFADTAFWSPSVVTDARGEAVVTFTWPDNLTQWRATARGWTQTVQVGEATADVETKKDLLVRLQAPRFFVERDEVVLSANVHNYTAGAQRVRVRLELEGDTLVSTAGVGAGAPGPRPLRVPRADRSQAAVTPASSEGSDEWVQWVDVPQDGEKRVDWRVRVERAGKAKLRVTAETPAESDAMELEFPVFVHGVEKLIVKNGSMLMAAGDPAATRAAKLTVDLPLERAPDSGELVVQVSPSIASAMLDALPYLVDYPYGCTEQTMSRFLPAVVAAKTLTDLGVNLQDLRRRARLEWERRKEDNPANRPEESGYSYPEGAPGRQDVERQARDLWYWRANRSPVYNPDILKDAVRAGLVRLRSFQNADGGWGWWKGDATTPEMTAYVLQGLMAGKAAGMNVPADMLDRGYAALERAFKKATNPHDVVYLGWVLSLDAKRAPAASASLLKNAYPDRERLTAYSLAMLALALHGSGRAAEARVCLENLENTAKIDAANGTCSWVKDDGAWWSWYNNDVETAAMCLRVYNTLAPTHRLAPMVVRWLSNNRQGNSWSSTRETALCVQALAEYVKVNRELAPEYTVTVDVGGKFKRAFKVDTANALLFDNRLVVPSAALGSGPQTVAVTRSGKGNLYYTAYLRYFTLEEGIEGSGNEIQVRRRYLRLTKPEAGSKPTGLTADGYIRSLVKPGEALTSGDLLEVELLIESKNRYEYLVFEDMKPAGCEPVDLRSGSRYADGLCSNMELRDEKVAFFITSLPQGRRIIRYRVRAEIPGRFHALPHNAYAMYAPAVRALSDEGNFGIQDAPAEGSRP